MKQQRLRFVFGSTLVVAFAAMVQAEDAFVDSVQIEVTPMASPAARAASVDWGVDLDHDQFITREEIELALAAASENYDRATRGYGGVHRGISSIRMRRARERLQAVSAAYLEFDAVVAEELSIANADFRLRFADLNGNQRTLLMKADTRGNNDGSLSVIEYVRFNEDSPFSKGAFEREFGEFAHDVVMSILLTTTDPEALNELGISF